MKYPTPLAHQVASNINQAYRLIGQEPDDPYRQNARHDLGCLDEAAHRPDRMSNPRVGSDDLGDNNIGPAPAERDMQVIHRVWQHGECNLLRVPEPDLTPQV